LQAPEGVVTALAADGDVVAAGDPLLDWS
ncbi:PTS glucose transporter subunit IIA, partial [Cellulomonas rhizosphaerae]